MDTPPLPMGTVVEAFRFLFSGVPQWIQIAGVVLGTIVALAVIALAIRHRAAILAWLGAKSRGFKIALGAGVGGTVLAAALVGGWSYNYMMTENDFCSSCHVMKSAFGKFQTSEHTKLKCHDCHQQSIFASTRELYYWVLDRPDKIPVHSRVPNKICTDCHITQQRDSVWQRISATSGHQVHLKSDSSALRDVTCLSCHAQEVHAFKATDLSCGESGCHENQKIKLVAMANQSSLHCITCHEFARPVAETISVDSTKAALVPVKLQCFSCHEMQQQLAKRGLDKDPHKAACGICHNPHVQEKASGALKSCATSECHANADTLTAFHRGLGTHVIDNCSACHTAHSWKVESTECIGCHKTIFDDRRKRARRSASIAPSPRPRAAAGFLLPPAPHRSVIDRSLLPAPTAASAGHPSLRGGPSPDGEIAESSTYTWNASAVSPAPLEPQARVTDAQSSAAPFSHARHRKVKCESCHSSKEEHGAVFVRTPAGCQSCHHAKDERSGQCATCHASDELKAKGVDVTLRVSTRKDSVTRVLTFDHSVHAKHGCAECHDDSVGRRVVTTCTGCHENHHTIERTCATCHQSPREKHQRVAHDGCAACHKDATVAALNPGRSLCLVCHAEQEEHKPSKDCVACHRVSWNEVKPVEDRT